MHELISLLQEGHVESIRLQFLKDTQLVDIAIVLEKIKL